MNKKIIITGLLSILITSTIKANNQAASTLISQEINQSQDKYAHLSTQERKEKMIELFKEFLDKGKARNKGFHHYVNEFKEVCNDNGDLWKSLGCFCNAVATINSASEITKLEPAFKSIGDEAVKNEMKKLVETRWQQTKAYLAIRYRFGIKKA